jgi:hypothetical protein
MRIWHSQLAYFFHFFLTTNSVAFEIMHKYYISYNNSVYMNNILRDHKRPSSAPSDKNISKPSVRQAWQENASTQAEKGLRQSSEESLMHAIHTMQNKYTQNIQVIEQLFQEKEEMADKVRRLEEELEHTRSMKRRNDFEGMPAFDFDMEPLRACSGSADDDDSHDLFSSTRKREHHNRGLVSAAQAADMFSDDDTPNGTLRESDAVLRKRRGKKSTTKTIGLSPQLQADTDRYLQKIKYVQDKKKLEILEQEKYELDLERRRLRASKTGGEFTRMREREEVAKEQKRNRDERKLRKELEREAAGVEEKNKTTIMNANLRNSLKNSKSWDDIQKEEEIRRRDRIEKRKQHLSSSAAYPSASITESVDKWKTKDVGSAPPPVQVNTFNVSKTCAPSPAEISVQLKRRQDKWERHLQKEKEILNSKRKNTLPVQSALEMEHRQKLYDESRRQKQLDRERKEAEDKQRKSDESKRRTERIMRSKVPESSRRLTKATEDRAKTVRDSFEMSRKKDLEDKKKEMRKMRRSKEVASFLRTLVGGKDSSTVTEAERLDQARRQAEENANAYKQSRKLNQERIRASLAQRPSLIERHDMTIAASTAATTALGKVANIVRPRPTHGGSEDGANWRNDFESDGLFDDDEKIQLGIRDN